LKESRFEEYTVDDLHALIFPEDGETQGYLCMVFNGFLDDSKDRGAQRIMTSAGFVASQQVWTRFRQDWKRVLASYGLEYFKSSECFSLTGQFASFRKNKYGRPEEKEAAQHVRSELQQVIADHRDIRGIGVVVQLEDYRRIAAMPEARDVLPENPYRSALCSVMFETVGYLRKIAPYPMVAFVHDEEDDFDDLRISYKEFRQLNKKTARCLGGFAAMDDKRTPELQAADLLASHTTFLAGKEPNLRANLLEMKRNISHLGVWNEEYILAVLKRGIMRRKGQPLPIEDGGTIAE
jgi:hypothetical protein